MNPATQPTQLHPGMVVTPTIRLVSPLGRGGMGSVWVAEHLALHTQVVVKFMATDLALHAEAIERFSREAAAAAQVKSPHVVQMLDHGVTPGGVPFIAMEMLEGQDLGKLLAAQGRLPLLRVAEIIGQVCKALARAHERGIVHRDIKPDNIFLCEVGGGETFVKLLDFGIAKGGDMPLGGSSGTRTGTMIGTPHYMSPEQVVASKGIDLRTDLWSLGIVAYECVLGRKPIQADSFGALAVAIHAAPLPRPTNMDPSLPATFDTWFGTACARDPAARFSNARELADALYAVASGAAWTPASPAPKWGGETVAASTGPWQMTPVPGGGTPNALAIETRTHSGLGLSTGPQTRAGGGAGAWIAAGLVALVLAGGTGVWLLSRKGTAPTTATATALPSAAASPPSAPVLLPPVPGPAPAAPESAVADSTASAPASASAAPTAVPAVPHGGGGAHGPSPAAPGGHPAPATPTAKQQGEKDIF